MSRPLQACVDLAAIQHNYRLARACAGGARALAVIKANAYGHGAVAVARALVAEAAAFGVACVEEALELRESGIHTPILLLEGPFETAELELVDQVGLMTVVHDARQLDWVLGARPQQPLSVWLKIDTGMHRLGLTPEDGRAAYARLAACPHVGELVLMTHFARADEADPGPTDRQLADFATLAGSIPTVRPATREVARSLANSAAILTRPDTHAEWVRPGIMLYGLDPLDHPHPHAALLRPALCFVSELTAVRELAAGEAIGYGGRFVCERPTRVGVVATGYADGYPRHAPDGTPVAVNGQLTRLIGRVSMDMLMVDLSEQPQAQPGDPVELWGTQVSANAVAAASGTISYELLTGLSRRVPLRYVEAASD
ncbi:alanine racemase [Thiorhodovibrio frisius]|uniref:Alanine racemase n=1 Tax=Thiorhodovibrio frisius TaxID=631362 RepID=H8YZL0_9GAMM|nr:alanine racemase [Thiorhodovibrio frisius]EIC22137.1 alanine racemase [Thiorhodovibrio frisius]WPL24431.1 Alanine racemase, catabolic [Thiorhodovibrio frisius]